MGKLFKGKGREVGSKGGESEGNQKAVRWKEVEKEMRRKERKEGEWT